MDIKFYKSSLCPRCYLAKKKLYKLAGEYKDIEITEIDVLTSPGIARKDGILMIPAITVGDNKLSALFLGQEKIEKFLKKCIQEKTEAAKE